MKIKVTDFETSVKEQFMVDHVIGLFDPCEKDWCHENLNWRNRDMWWFDDTHESSHGQVVPSKHHIRDIIKTVKEKDLLTKNIIVHCRAGIGRSTATAMALLIMSGVPINDALKEIERQRPFMWPNEMVAKHFDDELGLNGEFLKTVSDWKKNNLTEIKNTKIMWMPQADGSWAKEEI